MTNRRFEGILCLLVWTSIYVIYGLGLPGGFLLDDFANLSGLTGIVGSNRLEGIGKYILTNPSGDLGRPIPMLTFVLQAADWPGAPERFKLVNIGIHALNASLLFAVLCLLLGAQPLLKAWQRVLLSLVVTMLWVLHPLHVSTVLYTVQRMTELASTFMLFGLLLYLRGRLLWNAKRDAGMWQMAAGVLLGTLFAALCKENGLLFPLVVAFFEITILCFAH